VINHGKAELELLESIGGLENAPGFGKESYQK